jgi:hypothetical protein
MTTLDHPVRLAFLFIAGVIAVVLALSSLRYLGAAHAESPVTEGSRP